MSNPLVLVSIGAARLRSVGRRARVRAAAVEAVLARTGLEPEVTETLDAARASHAIAAALARGAGLVVVVGGDGSVRTAALALAGSGVAIGIVPAGTGNLFASTLRLPRDPIRAARLLAELPVRDLDLGRATTAAGSTGFVAAAGVGFDARVMAATTPASKARFGLAAYFAAALGVAASVRGTATRIIADGTVYEVRALATLVANAGELIPGVLGPREPFRPDDGLLDVIAVTGTNALDGMMAGLALLLQRSPVEGPSAMTDHGALRIRARAVSITTDPPEPIEIDGDVVWGANGWLDAAVEAGALKVLAPGRRGRATGL